MKIFKYKRCWWKVQSWVTAGVHVFIHLEFFCYLFRIEYSNSRFSLLRNTEGANMLDQCEGYSHDVDMMPCLNTPEQLVGYQRVKRDHVMRFIWFLGLHEHPQLLLGEKQEKQHRQPLLSCSSKTL